MSAGFQSESGVWSVDEFINAIKDSKVGRKSLSRGGSSKRKFRTF
jgi:hypothetical protein